MADKTFNDVKINLTLKPQTTRANVSSSQEDLAVQMGKIQKWFADMDSHIPFNSHYGICDTAAATVAKTVSCTGFTLTTGALIVVKFTVTNTGAVASLTLNVNNTGAKSIKYRGGNVSSAGNLAANRVYAFVYDGTYWNLIGDFDTNTYDRTYIQTRIYAGTKGVFPYSLCAMDTAQRMQAFTTTGGTATTKVFNSSEKFLYPPVIMYHAANSTITNGSVIASNALYEQYPAVDMRYNANVTSSAAYTQYKSLYIECTVDSDGYWSPTGITQTFTSGKYYILLGCMYQTSIYQLALFAQHPMYYYNGTKLIDADIQLSDSKYALTTHTHDVFSTSADGFVPKASTSGDTDKFLKGDGTWATPPSGTDTKVTQNNTTSNSNYRLLLSASANDTTETNTSNKSTKFQANPSTGTLTATNFAGKINNHTVNADVPDGAVFTDTTYTAGTGLALNGTTFNHANSAITAQTTQALYPIKYDTQGHITGAGSAVTTLKNPTALTVKYNTTQSFTYDGSAAKTLSIKAGSNVTVTGDTSGNITIAATDTNTDTKVTQAYSTTNNSYPLLFSATAGISSTASRGAQTSILNNQIYANPSTGVLTATAFTGNMTPKVLTSSTLASTEGNFFFSGSGLLENPSAYDWVGIQAGDADDKWQLTLHDGHVYVRQNDSGGTSSTNWTPWKGLIDPFLVTAEDGLTVTKTQTIFGSGDTALEVDTGVKIGLGSEITIQGLTVNTTAFGSANPKIVFNNANGSQAVELQMNDYDSIAAPASLTLVGNQGNEYLIAPQFAARTEMGKNLTACQNTTLTKYGLYFRSYRTGTSQNYAAYGIRTYDGKANANNGMLLTVGGGGLTVIGSGEAHENIANLIADDQSTASPTKFYPVESETDVGPYNGSDEELIIASDQNIFLLTYCNNMENRGGWRVSWAHHLVPLQSAHSTIGTTTYYVKNIYTNELVAATSTTSRSTNIHYSHGVVCKPSDAASGGWTMGLIFRNFADTQLLQFGVMGAGQTLDFGFIGPAYNDNWMRFYPTEIRTYKNPITRNTTVSAWSYVKARDNGIVYSNFDQDMSLDRFYPAFFAKSHTGGWAVGSNGSNDRLYFSFSTDTVYSAGSGSVSNFYVESNGVTNIRPTVINSTLVTPSTETNYTVPIHTGTLSTGDKYMYNTSGFTLSTLEGTTSAAGISRLKLGNNTASGTAGNKTGAIQLFSTTAYYTELRPISGVSANRTVYFPNETGYALLSTQSAPQALLYSGSSNNPGTETITISNLFTNYKVIYVVVQKAAYGHNQEASEWYGHNFIVPLQFVKSKSTTATIGTTANPGYFVQIGYHPHLGQTYRILVQYVDASNIKISIVNDATTPVIQMTNTLGTIKIYGIY